MPAWSVMHVMVIKLATLAIIAGVTAQHYKKVTIPLLITVVLISEVIGSLSELLLTGGVSATIADFTIGWPGLLLQVFGTYILLKIFKK